MRMYRFRWTAVAGLVGVVAVAGALFAPFPVVVLVAVLASSAGIMAVRSPVAARQWADRLAPAPLRRPPRAGQGLPSGDAHTDHTSAEAVPADGTRLCSHLRAALGLGGADPDPARWTDEQLCWAWRASFTKVRATPYAIERDAWAAARARYLDELQRRDATGFARWMASGARAGSNPARYLSSSRHPQAPEHSDQ